MQASNTRISGRGAARTWTCLVCDGVRMLVCRFDHERFQPRAYPSRHKCRCEIALLRNRMVIPYTEKFFAIGLDIAPPGETSAFAVVERVKPQGWNPETRCPPEKADLHVRNLQRFPPGTLY